MVRRNVIAGTIGGVLLIGIAAVILLPSNEPAYQGRALSAWLMEREALGFSATQAQRKPFDEAIRQFGTNSLPWLLKWVKYQRPAWYRAQNSGSRLLRAVKPLRNPVEHADQRATAASRAFAVLGSNAVGAITELNRMIARLHTNDNPRPVMALAAIGDPALPSLISALTNWQCCQAVSLALTTFGTNARPAVPILIQGAQSKDEDVARFAIEALGRLRLEPDLVLPVLTTMANDPRPNIRATAVIALNVFQGRPNTFP